MKIELTRKQYEALIKLIYLGEWVINAYRTDDRLREFEEVEQHILSFYEEFGMERNICFDKELKRFFMTREFEAESHVHDYIDEYNENTFWDELIFRLARRDLIERYGEEAIKNMDLEEMMQKEGVFIDEYEEEFERNGIKNLVIGKDYKPLN